MNRLVDTTSKSNPLTYDKFVDDINYIKNEIISQLPNGKYIKYSRLLHAVVVMDFTKNDCIRYWNTRYIRNGKETIFYKDIIKAVETMFESGLTPLEEMTKLIENSHDDTVDKVKALKLLKGK